MPSTYIISDHQDAHFISFASVQWVDVLSRPLYKDIVIDALRHCLKEKGLILYAYIIMNNQALGAAYFKMSLAITFTFVPLVVAAIISPLITDLSILIWLGMGTVSIFGFFLLPQIGIHNIMAHEKQQRLLSFSNHLEISLERSLKEPTPENLQHLKELFDLQAHLKSMNEWPFNVNTLWQLITALLIPLTLGMIEVFFNK